MRAVQARALGSNLASSNCVPTLSEVQDFSIYKIRISPFLSRATVRVKKTITKQTNAPTRGTTGNN